MKDLIEFMKAVEPSFVFLVGILLGFLLIWRLINTFRREMEQDRREKLEKMRIDAARSIVPINRNEG